MKLLHQIRVIVIIIIFATCTIKENLATNLEYKLGAPYYDSGNKDTFIGELMPYSLQNNNSINIPPQSDRTLNNDIIPNVANNNNNIYSKENSISNSDMPKDNVMHTEINSGNQLYEIVNVKNKLSSNPDYTYAEIISHDFITGHFSNYYYQNINCSAVLRYINVLDEFYLTINNPKEYSSAKLRDKRRCQISNESFEARFEGMDNGLKLAFDKDGQRIINAYMRQGKDFTIIIEQNDGLEDVYFTIYEFTINSFGFNDLYTIIHSNKN